MTSETRTLIEIRDIVAVELECYKCHTKILVPVEETGPTERTFPHKCPHCTASLVVFNSDAYENLKKFVAKLKHLPDEDIPAKVRLLVKGVRE